MTNSSLPFLKVTDFIVARPQYKQIPTGDPPFDVNFNCSFGSINSKGDIFIVASCSDEITIGCLSLQSYRWFPNTITLQAKSSRVQLYPLDEYSFLLVSVEGDSIICFFNAPNMEYTVHLFEYSTNSLFYFFDGENLVLIYPKPNQGYVIKELNTKTLCVNEEIVNTEEFPLCKNVFCSTRISESDFIFYTMGKDPILLYNSSTKKFMIPPEWNSNDFVSSGIISNAIFHHLGNDNSKLVLFHNFKACSFKEGIPIYIPSDSPQIPGINIVLGSLIFQNEISAFISSSQKAFLFLANGKNNLRSVIFSKPDSPPELSIEILEFDKMLFSWGNSSFPFLFDSATIVIKDQVGQTIKIIPINYHEKSNIKFQLSDPGKYSAHLSFLNSFGSANGTPVSFEVPSPVKNLKLKIYDKDDMLVASWFPPVNANHFVLEGSKNKKSFDDLVVINDPSATGIVAKISEQISYFRLRMITPDNIVLYSDIVYRNKQDFTRFIWTSFQRKMLEKYFEDNPRPSKQDKTSFAELLKAPERSVTFWFQNRRSILKGNKK